MSDYYIPTSHLNKDELPEHLNGIYEILREHSASRTGDKELARVLLMLLQNNPDNAGQIGQFISGQQQEIQRLEREYWKLMESVVSWTRWATIWTDRKRDALPKTKERLSGDANFTS